MGTKLDPHLLGGYRYSAFVKRVIDGDTIELDIDLGFSSHYHTTVRLHGIDAYEIRLGKKAGKKEKKLGLKAKQHVVTAIEGTYVQVETTKLNKGKYGRYIAIIRYMKKGNMIMTNLNHELVKLGYAVPKTY